MIITNAKSLLRLGTAALVGGLWLGAAMPVMAQGGTYGAVSREDPATALSRHLRTLAESPQSLSALIGAGQSALALGDAQAALTFFARAEQIAPRDGRVKTGMGAAFVAMEQPGPALQFFEDARAIGVPETEYAADRGLAYDLLGNPSQAQRDYATAIRVKDSDELRRRLALSRAITGDRAGALAAIEEQLRKQDRAAWRVRAFVLALTGDADGATQAVQLVMPAQAGAMRPFLARLPTLGPADRAMAVHFGRFPGDGTPAMADTRFASLGSVVTPNVTNAGRPDASQAPLSGRYHAPVGGATTPASATPIPRPVAPVQRRLHSRPTQVASARPDPGSPGSRLMDARGYGPRMSSSNSATTNAIPSTGQNAAARPPVRAVQGPDVSRVSSGADPVVASPVPAPTQPAPVRADPVATASPTAGTSSPPVGTYGPPTLSELASASSSTALQPAVLPASAPVTVAEPRVSVVAEPVAASGLAALAATIRSLPSAEEVPVVPKAAASTAKQAKAPARKESVKPKEVSRHWVQVAGNVERASLGREFARLKAKAPKLLAARSAWTSPAGGRLLVGPFESGAEAQGFVNQLVKADLDAFSWTSPVGQEVVKLPAK